jgi:hypothetical protein
VWIDLGHTNSLSGSRGAGPAPRGVSWVQCECATPDGSTRSAPSAGPAWRRHPAAYTRGFKEPNAIALIYRDMSVTRARYVHDTSATRRDIMKHISAIP